LTSNNTSNPLVSLPECFVKDSPGINSIASGNIGSGAEDSNL